MSSMRLDLSDFNSSMKRRAWSNYPFKCFSCIDSSTDFEDCSFFTCSKFLASAVWYLSFRLSIFCRCCSICYCCSISSMQPSIKFFCFLNWMPSLLMPISSDYFSMTISALYFSFATVSTLRFSSADSHRCS